MSNTVTVRLKKDLAAWLEATAARSGVPKGKVVRDALEGARAGKPARGFLRLAGSVRGPRDLSARKGFSRP